jgi:hypothetical protein
MKSLTGALWARFRQKFGIDSFRDRYLVNYPRLTRIFNVVVPSVAAVAVVFGVGLLSWQIISLAKPGEIRLSLPEANSTKNDDFHVQTKFTAAQDRNPFNIVFKLDGQVIESRVGAAIKAGESREYNFSSGVNGDNVFDRNLLSPGKHTLRIEAHTGTIVGQGAAIDTDETNFTVTNVNNLATWAESKTYSIDKLPLYSTTPRNALKPHSLQSNLANVTSSSWGSFSNFLIPKAEAATRHGDFNITAPPGIQVTVKPVASVALSGCKDNKVNADGSGIARFRDCEVSNQGGTSAVYVVSLGNTPDPYIVTDPKDRQVTVEWNTTKTFGFNYHVQQTPQPQQPPTGGAQAPAPTPTPTPTPKPAPAPVYNYAPDSGAFIALTNLSTTSATVDAFAAQMINNITVNYLKEVYVTVDGVKTSSVTQFSSYATQRSLGLSYPNLADGKDHALAFIAESYNGKTSWINIKITAQKAATTTTTTTQPTQNHDTGTISVTVYAHTSAGQKLDKDKDPHIGNVYVSTHNIGDNVGQCDPAAGLTDNTRDHVKNFGQIKFDKCPVALNADNNHAKKYQVSITIPSAFQADGQFNSQTSAELSGNVITREVTVQKDQDTDISFMLVGNSTNVMTPKPDETPAKPKTANITAYIVLETSAPKHKSSHGPSWQYDTDYSDLPLFLLPNIVVTASPVGTSVGCGAPTAITGTGQDQYYGVAVLKDCPLSSDGSARQYNVNVTYPDKLKPVTNLPVQVKPVADSANEVTITLKRK